MKRHRGNAGFTFIEMMVVVSIIGLLIVLVQPWLVPRLELWGRYRVIPLAALLFCGGFALHAHADHALAHLAVIAVWTLGEVAIFPLCNAVVSELAPENARGRYQGLYWMAWACSNVAGPPLGQARVAAEPGAFDEGAARRHRLLLVLRREGLAAHGGL